MAAAGSVLIANRGEVAVRILRAAADLEIPTVAVYAEDDAEALHVTLADEARALDGSGPRAYLDIDRLLEIAGETGASLLHPGYGFLAESAALARRCAEHGIGFVGPSPEVLDLLGDKLAARALAVEHGVPVPAGSAGATSLAEAREFLASLDGAPMVIKAVAGGGGRGMRVVREPAALGDAYTRARSEATAAFGNGDLYVERLVTHARHVEVQVVGDGTAVVHLGERDCSLQRRHQKLIEIAPAPGLPPEVRDALTDAAVRMASVVGYAGLGTFEFLVAGDDPSSIAFIEANPRLQVEHTVTEEIIGVDLVAVQLRLAGGASLAEVGLAPGDVPAVRGVAVQARVNLETVDADGAVRPAVGRLEAFAPPTGPGVRTDTAGYAGYAPSPAYDSLLAKVIAHADDHAAALRRADRALGELRLAGPGSNRGLLRALLRHPDVQAGRWHTRFVDEHVGDLVAIADRIAAESPWPGEGGGASAEAASGSVVRGSAVPGPGADSADAARASAPAGTVVVEASSGGTVVDVSVGAGDEVDPDTPVAVVEAMKMEHVVVAGMGGVVRAVAVTAGETVALGAPLLFVEERAVAGAGVAAEDEDHDLDHVRDDLREVLDRQAATQDAARPDAVARRHEQGQRTARENIDDLCDDGSFVEYGSLVLAAQRQRRDLDDLIAKHPGRRVDRRHRAGSTATASPTRRPGVRCCPTTRPCSPAPRGTATTRRRTASSRSSSGCGCRPCSSPRAAADAPGDTDTAVVSGLHTMAFALFGKLSGLVPLVGIASRYCFAGNAALLGGCDVIIATENASIGMGGPAMIEGGGLGSFHPAEVGPVDVQAPNGVVDVVVADEAAAVDVAKRYLSYFQGALEEWQAADQRLLRHLVPANRRRVYDIHRVIDTLADTGSVLELRRAFGRGMITALARVEGRSVGVLANNPMHLGGAIDTDAADKAARFLQLCDAHDVPVVFLCDTPGFMVGPDAERHAQVRHFARMFVTGASLTVPFMTVVLRKGYGLGAQAMAGGSFHAPLFTVSWPTGEFGGMNLEGAVRLGFKRELDAIDDPAEREEAFEQMVGMAYEHGKALNMASHFEIDDVIDPADTRRRIVEALRAAPPPAPRTGKKRPMVDPW